MRWARMHPLLAGVTVVIGALMGLMTFFVARPAARFREIASEQFTPELAREALGEPVTTTTAYVARRSRASDIPLYLRSANDGTPTPLTPLQLARLGSPKLPDDMFTSVLLIGADASGALADVILYVLLPNDGSTPIIASLPRDLWLPNPCTGGFTRINANLNGCGEKATGPEQLAVAVEDFTGIKVDHYARVNFAGFTNVIDWMGGVTVCVKAPTRDLKSHLDIPAGCQTADGTTALAWVRSRHTEQQINGEWKALGSSDFSRQQHQQDVLLQLASKLSTYRSPTTLADALSRLSSAVRMDSSWTLAQVASLGFRYRDFDLDTVVSLRLETEDYVTSGGAWVLLPTQTFNSSLAGVYPDADATD